ncbi:hypothetical protein GCM10007377_09700 [Galliscardovia ingluviei]|uniref:DUF4422 domain-containing protein n=1 Tax=Galliscardovia ingluviei TaxID=1769422 RepID=A0A8J3EZ95_9BIFI|nr:DUF4422 domain-containing protein [Galliscardovia ingluviei]GGI14191.1 hypothetical protein GCM10007377_09700 [Galliscardovia ingluviei]
MASTPQAQTQAQTQEQTQAQQQAQQQPHAADPRVKIFVSVHKPSQLVEGTCFYPVHVGSTLTDKELSGTLRDDIGENISERNPRYCELTAQYWAWKNVDADYYGFCHYRRYFDFSGVRHQENDYGEILDTYITDETIKRYGLDDEHVLSNVAGWDVITTPYNDVRKMDGFSSLKDHWNADDHLQLHDLRHMYDILVNAYPDYQPDADAVLNGTKAAFCNMFIMRKEIFHDYCQWLFPLLDAFDQTADMSTADVQRLRTVGHLSERLLNIYLAHQQRIGKQWRIKQLQCVHFTHPEPIETLNPLDINPRYTIPIVLAADDAYVPMLATTIHSILSNADTEYYYDFIVLHRNISVQNQNTLSSFVSRAKHASIRFYDVQRIIENYVLDTNNPHISIETYYRFIIQDILPFYKKVLYLDCDLIVNADIATLYATDIKNYCLAAVKDIDFTGTLAMKDGKRKQYTDTVLHMNNGFNYFQAGVMLLNLDELRMLHTVEEWLAMSTDTAYIYNDQDILNMECEGKVLYLDARWNVMHDCAGRVDGVFAFAPAEDFLAYQQARRDPSIVHYAGFEKPWKNPWCDFGPLYWHYAQQTPFSVQLIAMLAGIQKPKPIQHHDRAIAEDSPLRKYGDILAPTGSKQREIAKVIVRKMRGRK